MESISARCRRTGIEVLAGLVGTYDPSQEYPSAKEIRHVRPFDGRYGTREHVSEQFRS
jgi:hypothetical protein